MERKAEQFIEADCLLGESPVWDDKSQTLYWTDIERGEIHSHCVETGRSARYDLGGLVTSLVLCHSGNLLVTTKDTILLYDPVTGKKKEILSKTFPAAVRFNDGKCDPSGRFYADSMDMEEKEALGSLFVLDSEGGFRKAASGFVIGNGLAWNEDETILYIADSAKKTVYQFAYCAATGSVENRRTAIRIPDGTGVPDGMCIDSEGMLWIAHYYGARITRWNPVKGELLETVPVPAANVTSCCFGGKDMKTLYITTSGRNLPRTSAADRHDGSIFKIDTDIRGCEPVRFHDEKFVNF